MRGGKLAGWLALVGSLAALVLLAGGGAYLAFGQKDGTDNAAQAGARPDVAQVTPTPTVTDAVPTVDASEPTGLLTHHLDMDAAAWDFLAELFAHTRQHGAATWNDVDTVFGGVTSARSA